MKTCVPVPEELTIKQTRISAIRLGDLSIVTLPGEPLTTLGEYVLEKTMASTGSKYQMLFGYAQDYTGYLLLSDDWYLGGYEAASNLWGPRQGSYLSDHVSNLAGTLFDPNATLSFVPSAVRPYTPGDAKGYTPVQSAEHGQIVEDLPESTTAGAELKLSWLGGDPWLDFPNVLVERAVDGDLFEPYSPGGLRLDEQHYRLRLELKPEPPWEQEVSGPRSFVWSVYLRTAARVPAPDQALLGTLRILVQGKALSASGVVEEYSLTSNPVEMSP